MEEQNTGNIGEPSKKKALLLSSPATPSAYTTTYIYIKNTCSEGFVVISEFGRTERTGLHLHVSDVQPLPTANYHRNFILPEVR